MSNIKIKVSSSDIRKLEAKFGKARRFNRSLERSLNYLKSKVDKAPPKQAGAFTRLATRRQRLAYWAQVSSGRIRHGPNGYIRTGDTIRKWTTRVTGDKGILGNNAVGAPWVYGEREQQPFHRASGWPREDEVVNDNKRKIVKIFEDQIRKDLA